MLVAILEVFPFMDDVVVCGVSDVLGEEVKLRSRFYACRGNPEFSMTLSRYPKIRLISE